MLSFIENRVWLLALLACVTIPQGISIIIFLILLHNIVVDNYIYVGIFQYSDIQFRTFIVSIFMQIPSATFWISLYFYMNKKESNNGK